MFWSGIGVVTKIKTLCDQGQIILNKTKKIMREKKSDRFTNNYTWKYEIEYTHYNYISNFLTWTLFFNSGSLKKIATRVKPGHLEHGLTWGYIGLPGVTMGQDISQMDFPQRHLNYAPSINIIIILLSSSFLINTRNVLFSKLLFSKKHPEP